MNKGKLLIIFLTFIFVTLLGASVYTLCDVQVDKVVKITEQDIKEVGNKHFLLIDEREVLIPVRYFEKLDLEHYEEYRVKYMYNLLTKSDGEIVALKRYGEQPWGY